MRIQAQSISPEGVRLEYEKTGDWFSETLGDADERDFTVDGIKVRFSLARLGRTITVEGHVEARIGLTCCRCLKPLTKDLQTGFRYAYLPAERMPREADTEVTEEDVGIGYYEDVIDLGEIVAEQIVLEVPMKPLCGEACRGLCPYCGIDLNVADCGHKEKTNSSPFALLRGYPIKKQKR